MYLVLLYLLVIFISATDQMINAYALTENWYTCTKKPLDLEYVSYDRYILN